MSSAGKGAGVGPGGEPTRSRLPAERKSITHKFTILQGDKRIVTNDDGSKVVEGFDVDAYLTVGMYEDDSPGEMFLKIGKEGGRWKVYDMLMIAISVGLQYGIPLSVFMDKFEHQSFEPSGYTKTESIPIAKSIPDYIARWLRQRFI
jgi:ribonucleoside-diphosphate reductase alpha chain